jgi:hypothetical protein
MDMAYRADAFKDSRYVERHMLSWLGKIFGKEMSKDIQDILWQYYQLAFERRPEFMGWSQTEPTTKTNYTSYNHFYYGDQARQRIDSYEALEKRVKALRKQMKPDNADAFYELVYYPVIGASLMNKKFLYRDKSYWYARQNRASAFDYAALSQKLYDSIVKETDYYNNILAKGKWKNMMSMKPRNLPVYQPPVLPEIIIDTTAVWSVAPEGWVKKDSSLVAALDSDLTLPKFNSLMDSKYFVDIFLNSNKVINWTSSSSSDWIRLSQQGGILAPEPGKKQVRIWVTIDWNKAPKSDTLKGTVTFKGAGKQIPVSIVAYHLLNNELKNYKGFVENNGYVSIYASHYTRQINHGKTKWEVIEGLGHTGKSVELLPLKTENSLTDKESFKLTSPCLEYDFYTFTTGEAEVSIYTLPTHPLNKNSGMRYAVAIDDNAPEVLDFKTVGRSEEWKQNVLRNNSIKKFKSQLLNKGRHVLKIYAIDPGVILDRITIDLGGLQKVYGTIPETKVYN